MKQALLLALPALFLGACADTQPMPRDPSVARRIERMDGGAGDVPSVNHPDLDPGRRGYYDDHWGGPSYDSYGRPIHPSNYGHRSW